MLNVAKFEPVKNKFEDPVAGMLAGLRPMTDGADTCNITSDCKMTIWTRVANKLNACVYELDNLTLQAESDCQAVDAAAVSSLTFMLMSCVVNFDANTDNSKDPVVGSD